jgi:PIN domain nuclease of toxin-antitoxin system
MQGLIHVPDDFDDPLPPEIQRYFEGGDEDLAITFQHVTTVEHLPRHHNDPFDRLLIAQAMAENLTIVTGDVSFAPYAVAVIRT